MKKSPKTCTVCGEGLVGRNGKPVTELFDANLQSKSGILKLTTCESCGAVADKYLELDGTLLCIDLVLQTPDAFRHVLLNSDRTKLILKMTLLAAICDGYIWWSNVSRPGEFFEQEFQFYIMCCKSVIAMLGFLVASIVPGCALARGDKAKVKNLVLGMLMAYSSRFFNLFALLWSTNGFERSLVLSRGQVLQDPAGPAACHVWPSFQAAAGGLLDPLPTFNKSSSEEDSSIGLMWAFVYLLFYSSSVRAHQVTLKISAATSIALISVGHAVFLIVLNLDFILQQQSFILS